MFWPPFDLYVQLYPGRLVAEVPGLPGSTEATGAGFDHPRMPIGDFTAADAALKRVVLSLAPSIMHRLRRLLFHVQHEWEGGLTQVDVRAIKDLAVSAGARHVTVYILPKRLSDADVQRLLRANRGREPGLA